MARLDLKERIRGRTRVAVAQAGGDLESFLRSTGPEDSGDLIRNTRVTPAGPNRLRIEVLVDYASYVREGTRGHTLPKKQTGVYVFDAEQAITLASGRTVSGTVYTRGPITHPGIQANQWYDDGINRLPDLVQFRLVTSVL